MSICRSRQTARASRPPLRCGISFIATVLISLAIVAPSAAAIPVGPVEIETPAPSGETPPSVPSVPQVQAEAPSVPPVQVEVPAAPQGAAVKAPSADVRVTTPNSSHSASAPSGGPTKASSTGADLPEVDEVVGGTKGSAGPSTETAHQAAPSAHNLRGSRGVPPGVRAGSLESAKVAPALLAYVWPAFSLGPAGELLRTLQARLEAAISLPAVDVPRLLLGLAGVSGAGPAAEPSKSSTSSNPSPRDSRGIWFPSGGEISLFVFLVACAALMALLIFTLRRELRAMHRWPL